MTCDGTSHLYSNAEYLAEAHAQAMLTERMRNRQIDGIRRVMVDAERIETVTTANLIAAIRKIIDEDVPF